MRVLLEPSALVEAQQAQAYYAAIFAPLADQFRHRLDQAVARVAENPRAWAPYLAGTRRCLLTGFPYSLVYRVLADHVQVIALAHQSRRPGYWRGR